MAINCVDNTTIFLMEIKYGHFNDYFTEYSGNCYDPKHDQGNECLSTKAQTIVIKR